MKLNSLQKVILTIFLLLILSTPLARVLTPQLTEILFAGKSFTSRSESIQYLLQLLFTLIFFASFYLIFIFFRSRKSIKQIGDHTEKTTIPGLQRILKKFQDSRPLVFVIIGFAVVIFIALLFVHLKIITFPYQLELREGNEQLTTYAFLHGINPYSIPDNPKYINIYGILFNLFMLPFASVFGNTLQLHRLLNGCLILLQVLIVIRVFRIKKVGWLATILAAGFIWLGELFFSTPLARPDALGGCLFLLAVFVPWLNKFDSKSLFFSAVLGVLSYQTKFYFFLSVVIIASYLFLFVSKQKAVIYALLSGILFVMAVFIIYKSFDTYFVNSLYVSSGSLAFNLVKMMEQVIKFLRDYWGFFLFAFFLLKDLKLGALKKNLTNIKLNLKGFAQPLLSDNFHFIKYSLAVTMLIVVLVLNNGTSQVYYYHLVTPFLVFLALSGIDKHPHYRNWFCLIATMTLMTQTIENLKPDFMPFDLTDWNKLETRISSSTQVLNSPLDVSILLDQNKPIAISGHTQFYFLFPNKRFFLFPDPILMRMEGEKFISQMASKIRGREYDFLETIENDNYEKFLIGERLDQSQSNQKFISAYYHQVEILTIPMAHTNEIWKIGIWEPN